ncbi:hypothetical protein [Phytoactinopolyspora halotolerans]|uniref:Uncharacterized protein n=1 Tax=Phytoactinopolyspora halotolerans TaxID=1981512 RepID=A0A6L9S6X5_9ACTN|nr:hypothetical protein [Phytoactinopolyspora halotolerans]NED99739.1 hypothetical protein [Phytoactinopolyspora halotolerans]
MSSKRRTTRASSRDRRRSIVLTVPLLLAATVTACGDDDDGAPGSTGGDGERRSTGTALHQALDRIEATSSTATFISFGDAARIAEASGGTFEGVWGSLTGWGADALYQHRDQLPEVLGIDLDSADALVTVGAPPSFVSMVIGGQDADDVASAATAAGWSGDDVLAAENDVTQPVTLAAPQVRAVDADVVVGGIDADLSVVDSDGTSLTDEPTVGSLADCLGDVLAAQFIQADPTPAAVGVRQEGDDPDVPVGVVCAVTGSPEEAEDIGADMEQAVASGETTSNRRPYSDYFTEPEVTVVDDEHIARVEMSLTPEAFAITIFQMAMTDDLPGLALGYPSAG